jgi:hypothetical protein
VLPSPTVHDGLVRFVVTLVEFGTPLTDVSARTNDCVPDEIEAIVRARCVAVVVGILSVNVVVITALGDAVACTEAAGAGDEPPPPPHAQSVAQRIARVAIRHRCSARGMRIA